MRKTRKIKYIRVAAMGLLLSTILSFFSVLGDSHVALASPCPGEGRSYAKMAEDAKWTQCGCKVCGGTVCYIEDGMTQDEIYAGLWDDYVGKGYQKVRKYENGQNWDIYYKCYNCGVVPKESVILLKVPAGTPVNDADITGTGPGYVPWYYCTDCEKSCEGGFRGGHLSAPNKISVTYYLIDNEGNVTTETEEKPSALDGTKPSVSAKGFPKYELDGSATTCSDSSWVISSGGKKVSGIATKNVTISFTYRELPAPTQTPTPTPKVVKEEDENILVTPKPAPTATPIPVTPVPLPTTVPYPFPTLEPIRTPNPPQPARITVSENDHIDDCYVRGSKHICTNSCRYENPNYHYHYDYSPSTSNDVSWDCYKWQDHPIDCSSCPDSGLNAGYVWTACSTCGGDHKIKCTSCNGVGTENCSSCTDGTKSCADCGGDGKVAGGTCGGTFKDSRSHTVMLNGTVTCTGGCSNGKKKCYTCGGSGKEWITPPGSINGYQQKCSSCSGSGNSDCSTCNGNGFLEEYKCSDCSKTSLGSSSGVSHTYSYKCSVCGASSSSSGTCKKTGTTSCSSCGGDGKKDCATCGGDHKVNCSTCNGAKTLDCSKCNSNGNVPKVCSNCGGTGLISNMQKDLICGYSNGQITGYSGCGKLSGEWYYGSTLQSPVCDQVLIGLQPYFEEQTLQIGQSVDARAYATFVSTASSGTTGATRPHGNTPQSTVTCSVSGFDSTKYDVWQTVTLSYGQYNGTAKTAGKKTVTIKVYIVGTVKVSFDADGGTYKSTTSLGGNYWKNVTYGEKYGTLPVVEKENYSFYGWAYNGAVATKDSIVSIPEDHTLKAVWVSDELKVSFDANGGSYTNTSPLDGNYWKTVLYKKTYGTFPSVARTGYTLNGWWLGSEQKTPSSTITFPADHTLTAVWTPNRYNITLHPNGGTCGISGLTVEYDATYGNTITESIEKDGYTFVGWYTDRTNGTKVFDASGKWCESAYWVNGKWKHTNDILLYARWTPKTYEVTLDGQGATTLPQNKVSVIFNRIVPNILVPSRVGYLYKGYYTVANGQGYYFYDTNGTGQSAWLTPSNGSLYAYWEPITYSVQYIGVNATDGDMDISVFRYGNTYTLRPNTYTTGFTVSYSANQRAGSTTANEPTLTNANTLASATFLGWSLTEDGPVVYGDRATVSNLTTTDGAFVPLYTKWESGFVTLPVITRPGYIFKGWTESYKGTGTRYAAGAKYNPTQDTVLYANWEAVVKDITLNGRGATKHTQTSVTVKFDETSTSVTPPEKNGYLFDGYYTSTNGGGTKYYDETGVCLKEWTEVSATELYANWVPDEFYYPEAIDPIDPTPEEEVTLEDTIVVEGANVLLYADDYDSTTDSLTDMQPYIAYDIVVDGKTEIQGAIPSSESIAIRAKAKTWFMSYNLQKRTGKDYIKTYVTIPYRTQYERVSDETLVISELKTKTYEFMIPRVWSYWEVSDGQVYYLSNLKIQNEALKDKEVTIPVDWTVSGAATKPEYTITSHGDKTEHLVWPEYETNGDGEQIPCMHVTIPEEQYIISYIPGVEPDVDSYLETIGHNYAWGDTLPQYKAKSDSLIIEGTQLLSDELVDTGIGASPDEIALDEIKNKITSTIYAQIYKPEIMLDPYIPNGRYPTTAFLEYTRDENSIGSSGNKVIEIDTANEINIHTPIACDGQITVEDKLYGKYTGLTEEKAQLVLDQMYNFFKLKISNTGAHNLRLGYGYGNFAYGKSGRPNIGTDSNGILYNQVKFPFDVFCDIGNDSYNSTTGKVDTTGDKFYPKETWITIGEDCLTFYVPITQQSGVYTITFRTPAVNADRNAYGNYTGTDGTQKHTNKSPDAYIVTDTLVMEIKNGVSDVLLTGTDDPSGQKPFNEGKVPVLSLGYNFNYLVKTTGAELSKEESVVQIVPKYTYMTKDGKRIETDVYYHDVVNGQKKYFVKVGSETDALNTHIYANTSPILQIPKSKLSATGEVLNDDFFAGKTSNLFGFNKIILDKIVKMLSGVSNTYFPSMYCKSCNNCYKTGETWSCGHFSESTYGITNINEKSAYVKQDWYGTFRLPAETFVVTKDTKEGYCPHCGLTKYVTDGNISCPDCGSSLTNLQMFDFNKYASQATFSGEELFFRKDGYLIISYELQIIVNETDKKIYDWKDSEIANRWKSSNLKYENGDVVIYRLDRTSRDDYEVGGNE